MVRRQRIDLYDKTEFATHPEIERKGRQSYTSLEWQHVQLLQDSRRLAIRLPEDQRAEL